MEYIDKLFEASVEEICEIDGYGEIMAQSVYDYFQLEGTKHLIEELKELGVEMKPLQAKKKEGLFLGKTFVLTGTLSPFFKLS